MVPFIGRHPQRVFQANRPRGICVWFVIANRVVSIVDVGRGNLVVLMCSLTTVPAAASEAFLKLQRRTSLDPRRREALKQPAVMESTWLRTPWM